MRDPRCPICGGSIYSSCPVEEAKQVQALLESEEWILQTEICLSNSKKRMPGLFRLEKDGKAKMFMGGRGWSDRMIAHLNVVPSHYGQCQYGYFFIKK